MLPDGSLAGRVALVTGGGSGLGRRRHVLEETVAQLEDGVAVPADVREPTAVAEAFDVNAAGNFHVQAEELSPNGWRAVVGIVLAKAGVVNLTRTLAVEWAPHGIRVNAISPGPVGTEQEIAHACSYLVSDYAAYVTGDVLTVDGGAWLEQGMFR